MSHQVAEMIYRMPNLFNRNFDLDFEKSSSLLTKINLELREKGIVKIDSKALSGYEDLKNFNRVTADFKELIAYIENNPPGPQKLAPAGYLPSTIYREWEVNKSGATVHAHDPFKFKPELLSLAIHPFILALLSKYFRRKFYLQQSIASRYYPMSPAEFGSFQWHHDGWGKKINVMILLSDVSDDDQYMTFVEGSHRYIYNFDRCSNSRFTEEEVLNLFPNNSHKKCTGEAGTIYIFDSNGMHRGNRSLGRARDSLITSFNAGRYIWDFELNSGFKTRLNPLQVKFVDSCSKIKWV